MRTFCPLCEPTPGNPETDDMYLIYCSLHLPQAEREYWAAVEARQHERAGTSP
jgi:hypothetical protein